MIMFVVMHKICGQKTKCELHSEAFNDVNDALTFCKLKAEQLLEPGDELLERKTVLSKPGYSIISNQQCKHKFIIYRITGDKND